MIDAFSSIGQLWNTAVKRSGIRRRNPYHTRHDHADRVDVCAEPFSIRNAFCNEHR